MRHLYIAFLHIVHASLGGLLVGAFLTATSVAQAPQQPQAASCTDRSPTNRSPTDRSSTLHDYVRQTVAYPPAALRAGVEGEVYLEYFVQASGRIIEVRTLQGIGHGCDEAAEEALRRAPIGLATPHLNAYEIKTKSILVVRFTLQNSTIATYEY